jgi:hypothetical protein
MADPIRYVLVVFRAPDKYTNEWNNFSGVTWDTMVRGGFPTWEAACEWARAKLPHGAPFHVGGIAVSEDE